MAYPIEISDKSRRCDILRRATSPEMRRRSILGVNGISPPFPGQPGLRAGVAKPARRGFEERDVRAVARSFSDTLFDRKSPEAASSEIQTLSLAHSLPKFGFDQDRSPFRFKRRNQGTARPDPIRQAPTTL
jgi:hypothetical protein